jgi:hypothetical protein
LTWRRVHAHIQAIFSKSQAALGKLKFEQGGQDWLMLKVAFTGRRKLTAGLAELSVENVKPYPEIGETLPGVAPLPVNG